MIGRFNLGVRSFIEGAKLLKNDSKARALGFIPAIMSLTLFTAGLVVGMMYIDEIMSWAIKSNMNDYNVYLKYLIYIFSFLLLAFILYFVTFIVVSILSIPVCTALSQRVLVQRGYLNSTKSFKDSIFTFAGMLRVSVLKLGFIIAISIMLFIASFVPAIAPIAVYLSLMILTFDCMDYAMEHDEQNLKQRFQFVFDHWVEFSGFSLCMAIVLAIPFVHFILLPTAVLGTTIMYAKIQSTLRSKERYDSKSNTRIDL